MAQVTFKLSELQELIGNRDSGVSLVPNCVRQLILSPFQLQDIKSCIRTNLYSTVAKYDPQLDGIILSYKKIKIEDFFCIQDDGRSKFRYTADIYVFKPKTGSILSGIINKKGSDHLGCLVHRVFNIAVPRPDNLNDDESWIGSKLSIGQEIQFKVVDVDLNEDMPYIKGELIDQPGLIIEESDEEGEDNEYECNSSYLQDNIEEAEEEENNNDERKVQSFTKTALKTSFEDVDYKIVNKRNKNDNSKNVKNLSPGKIKARQSESISSSLNTNILSNLVTTDSTKRYQKQSNLISNKLNDMYSMISSKLKQKEINDRIVNKYNKEKHVNDLKHAKDDGSRFLTSVDDLDESSYVAENLNFKKKKGKKSVDSSVDYENCRNLNVSETANKSSFNLSHENVEEVKGKKKKKKKKRHSSINEDDIRDENNVSKTDYIEQKIITNIKRSEDDRSGFLTPESKIVSKKGSNYGYENLNSKKNKNTSIDNRDEFRNSNISKTANESSFNIRHENNEDVKSKKKKKRRSSINEDSAHEDVSKEIYENRKNLFNSFSNDDDNLKKHKRINEFVTLNNISFKSKENYSEDYRKKEYKKKSNITEETNNSDSDQIDGFMQLKQTVSDIFADSINLNNYRNDNRTPDKYKLKKHECIADVEDIDNNRETESNVCFNNGENNKRLKNKYSTTDVEFSENDLEFNLRRKKKKKKDKTYRKENKNKRKDGSHLCSEDDHKLGSLSDSEYLLKESKRKKKKKKDKEKYLESDVFNVENYDNCFSTTEGDLILDAVSDSERKNYLLKGANRKKNKKAKMKNENPDFLGESYFNNDKKNSSYLSIEDAVGSLTDTECAKKKKKKHKLKRHSDYDFETIKGNLLNKAFERKKIISNYSNENVNHDLNLSTESTYLDKNRKSSKKKDKSSINDVDSPNEFIENKRASINERNNSEMVSLSKKRKRNSETNYDAASESPSLERKLKKRKIHEQESSDHELIKLQLLNDRIKYFQLEKSGGEEAESPHKLKKNKKQKNDFKSGTKSLRNEMFNESMVGNSEDFSVNTSEKSRKKHKKRKSHDKI